ncbi:hypothetical protein AB9F39_39035, partial [Rhizobium leguminosarum]
QTMSFDAARTEIHLRQNGADLEGAISVQDANTAIKDWPQIFPKFSASIDLTVAGVGGDGHRLQTLDDGRAAVDALQP